MSLDAGASPMALPIFMVSMGMPLVICKLDLLTVKLIPMQQRSEIKKIYQAAELLREKLKNSFTITTLAAEVSLSEKRLKAGFKAHFGKGVYAFLRDARMERARELLLEDKPIRYIAKVIGYRGRSAESNFIKAFHKRYGMTPAKWRNAQLMSDQFRYTKVSKQNN